MYFPFSVTPCAELDEEDEELEEEDELDEEDELELEELDEEDEELEEEDELDEEDELELEELDEEDEVELLIVPILRFLVCEAPITSVIKKLELIKSKNRISDLLNL